VQSDYAAGYFDNGFCLTFFAPPDQGMTSKHKLALFTSGSGTNAEEILKYFKNHNLIEVVLLLSNNPNAYALERAKKYHVPTRIFTKQQFQEREEVLAWLREAEVTHLVLAGFLWLVPSHLIKMYPHQIINIHPSLLPKYGGKGMYGMKVHEAVVAGQEKETGITIHEVDALYDEGNVLFQTQCSVEPTDTPQQVANKVHALEYANYPKVIEQWILKK
jgi:phosphoribosylglycinamide formyltransferase 1